MGVMSDLSGANSGDLPPIEERKALDIDVDNFNSRMQAMKPRVNFSVPNTLTGEGSLGIDITFESMDDFSPAAIARNVDSLAKLLEARTQLTNLGTYLSGKSGAEKLIAEALADPALLQSLAAAPKVTDAEPDKE
jgi:type VI secretion system protein ImpB